MFQKNSDLLMSYEISAWSYSSWTLPYYLKG